MRIYRYAFPVSLVLAIFAAACGGGAADSAGDSTPAGRALIGKPAPAFSVSAVANGKGKLALRDLRGKVVLVDFWGTFCLPCKKSFPKLQDLYTKYEATGLRIVGISEDEADDKGAIPGFAKAYGAKFTLGWDENKSIAHSYNPETMPSSFLIDKNGVIRYAHAGYHDGEEVEVENEIKELLGQ
jgi:cytochrome c biogenesis protein CcmG/thiol:disulfide interchange protein DsbE